MTDDEALILPFRKRPSLVCCCPEPSKGKYPGECGICRRLVVKDAPEDSRGG